jgi:hypothetical protein
MTGMEAVMAETETETVVGKVAAMAVEAAMEAGMIPTEIAASIGRGQGVGAAMVPGAAIVLGNSSNPPSGILVEVTGTGEVVVILR